MAKLTAYLYCRADLVLCRADQAIAEASLMRLEWQCQARADECRRLAACV